MLPPNSITQGRARVGVTCHGHIAVQPASRQRGRVHLVAEVHLLPQHARTPLVNFEAPAEPHRACLGALLRLAGAGHRVARGVGVAGGGPLGRQPFLALPVDPRPPRRPALGGREALEDELLNDSAANLVERLEPIARDQVMRL